MKNKNLLIAVIVLGVLGAIAFFTSNNGQSNQSSDKSGIGKEVVTKLDPTKISKITITDKDGSVSLEMKDEKWTVTERDGFIANFENIQKLVSSAVTLKSLRQVRASKKQHGRFELIDPSVEKENSGTKVDFKDTDNNVLKSLVLGKKNSSQSGANAGSPFGSSDNQRFVLVDGKISVIEIDFSSALNDIEASASE